MTLTKTLFYALVGICFYAFAFIDVLNGINCPKTGTFIIPNGTNSNISCIALFGPTRNFSLVIEWDNGQTSTASVNVTNIRAEFAFMVNLIGNIISGLFAPSTFSQTILSPSINTSCATPEGVTQLPGIGLALIGSLNAMICNASVEYYPGLNNTQKLTNSSRSGSCSFIPPFPLSC